MNQLTPYFPNSTYDTPSDTKRLLGDRLACNSRWYFAWRCFKEVLRGRSIALKGLYDTKEWAYSSYRMFQLIENCGGRFHLRGLENINKIPGPTVFIGNHMSTLETFVLPCIIAPLKPVTFIVKSSLVNHPLFGPVMRARNPIVVNRINPREDFATVINEGKKNLEKGISVVVFPQSTRSANFDPAEFNSIGIKLAKAANVPVVPFALKTDFWANGKIVRDFGHLNRKLPINMIFGEPFNIIGNGKDEHKKIIDFIVREVLKPSPTLIM